MQYHGAATGRWAGRGFQPHNMKRVETGALDVDATVDAIIARDVETVRKFGAPLTIIGDTARALICASSGKTLLAGDFSTIEARVLAWYAGETWKLDAFRRYDASGDPSLDVYLTAAGRVLRRKVSPEDEIGRHVGKTCELAFGFGGALGAWRNFDDSNQHTDTDVDHFKNEWRRAHPATTRFWRRLEATIKKAIRKREHVVLDNLACESDGNTLQIVLPSGRRIAYPGARLVPGKFKDTSDVVFLDNAQGGWAEKRAWYGIFVENVVSGAARDLLATALLRIDTAGYPIVLHVHDEVVVEVEDDRIDADAFKRLLTASPPWAKGLPIAAKVRVGRRYSKSKVKPSIEPAVISAAAQIDCEQEVYADDF